jgi:hypothetical protein
MHEQLKHGKTKSLEFVAIEQLVETKYKINQSIQL